MEKTVSSNFIETSRVLVYGSKIPKETFVFI